MSILATEEYLRKGHQIDFDMMNMDSVVKGVAKNAPDSVPSAELMTWSALKANWDSFYNNNIKEVPLLPWQDSGDLDTWLTRVEGWKVKTQKWANSSGNENAQKIAAAMPESPAAIEHKENPPSTKGKTPVWALMLLGTGLLAAAGYSIASVARLGGR